MARGYRPLPSGSAPIKVENEPQPGADRPAPSLLLKVGVLMMLGSLIPWIALPIAAWLAPTAGSKAAWSAGLFIAAEVLFWGGALLAGRDVWQTVKAAGWRRFFPELLRRLR